MRKKNWFSKKSFQLTLSVLVLLIGLCAITVASEWQYWSVWNAKHNISDKVQVSALTEIYFKNNFEDYTYNEYISYVRKLGYGLSVLGQLYFESTKNSANVWLATRSFVPGVSYETELFKICRVQIMDRVFYKLNSPSQWDYHRPRIYFIREIGKVKLTLSDEMRIDLTGNREESFYKNRIFISAGTKVSRDLSIDISYILQSDKIKKSWESVNIVQSQVTVSF
jgi:hypothetical protein